VLHVDTVAICLGVLSCVALMRSERAWLAALLCALAIGTKQTALPLPLAQLVFAFRIHGKRGGLAYLRWLALAGGALAVLFCGVFGARNLWFNLIAIPTRYPFEMERLPGEIAFAAKPVWWILPVAIAAWKWAPPRAGSEANREVQLGWLLLGTAVAFLPTGMIAVLKYGGAQNSLHSLAYGILGAALLAVTLARIQQRRVAMTARVALIAGAVALVATKLQRTLDYGYLGSDWSGRRHREAFAFVKSHPGQAYFPWNPLVTLMAERRDYPFEGAYRDYLKTSHAPSPGAIRAAFPATLDFVIYHESEQPTGEALAPFPDFTRKNVSGSWIFHTR
jgi:hypothetical protein